MVKIEKSSNKFNRSISRVGISSGHAASITGVDKLYRTVNNHFPAVTRKEIRKRGESNFSSLLRNPSRRTFEQNKVYAPEIDSLWDADLPFI